MFDGPPGSYDICKICFWEDDISQLRFPRTTGANRVSLIDGQKNFREFGACERRVLQSARAVSPADQRDEHWRPIDSRDVFEEPVSGVDCGDTYPKDTTRLYYWRR